MGERIVNDYDHTDYEGPVLGLAVAAFALLLMLIA